MLLHRFYDFRNRRDCGCLLWLQTKSSEHLIKYMNIVVIANEFEIRLCIYVCMRTNVNDVY